jgi:molybdate transport system substrate-binding protein
VKRVAILALVAAIAGCGGSASSKNDHPQLIVSAASSLRDAFADYAAGFKDATVRLSFGGSDELAAQIRAGGKPDVFAAANTKIPNALFSERKVEKPVVFTANKLVLAVPKGDRRVKSLDDLVKPGIRVAIGAASVPIGTYTRKVLGGLPSIERNRILANVKSEEPDVAGIVGKLTQKAVDAGLVYTTDVAAAKDSLEQIELPAKLQPTAKYEVAIVKGTKQQDAAEQFVDGLVSGAGQDALRRAGFLPVG